MILCVPIQIHYKGESNLRKKILSHTHTHTQIIAMERKSKTQIAAEHDNTAGSYEKPNNSDQN
jgi:hypothetical protein